MALLVPLETSVKSGVVEFSLDAPWFWKIVVMPAAV